MSSASDAFFAGGVSGSVGLLFTQPLDVIKVRQQTGGGSIFGIARHMVRTQGVTSMWKGLLMPCSTNGLVNATLFVSYEEAIKHVDSSTVTGHFVAGLAAGVAAVFVISPTELVKCIAQVDNRPATLATELNITRSIVRQQGLCGLLKGMPITMARDVPSFGFYFGVYEYLTKERGWSAFTSGGWAGVASWCFVYPLDVLKTEWQVARPPAHISFARFVRERLHIYAHHGGVVRGLYRGVSSCLLRAWPQHAVTFTVYEALKDCRFSASFTSPQVSYV
eukprot:TRINITY_DN54032_c0_g1_i1.p1 TRINITY_DN54032_c0_g1~~TRINITY_DN54032_c0_g1_i1.p1  ORF type:complete len:278 (+),score=74.25 TRINITY_DN54032_c0_g1_i1:131-964(+)